MPQPADRVDHELAAILHVHIQRMMVRSSVRKLEEQRPQEWQTTFSVALQCGVEIRQQAIALVDKAAANSFLFGALVTLICGPKFLCHNWNRYQTSLDGDCERRVLSLRSKAFMERTGECRNGGSGPQYRVRHSYGRPWHKPTRKSRQLSPPRPHEAHRLRHTGLLKRQRCVCI